jgi:hypothetical protein
MTRAAFRGGLSYGAALAQNTIMQGRERYFGPDFRLIFCQDLRVAGCQMQPACSLKIEYC